MFIVCVGLVPSSKNLQFHIICLFYLIYYSISINIHVKVRAGGYLVSTVQKHCVGGYGTRYISLDWLFLYRLSMVMPHDDLLLLPGLLFRRPGFWSCLASLKYQNVYYYIANQSEQDAVVDCVLLGRDGSLVKEEDRWVNFNNGLYTTALRT